MKIKCGAFARSTNQPCQAKALANGRCKNHGGMSTGPRSDEGRRAIAEATAKRMATPEGRKTVIEGYYRWLDAGGREQLKKLAKERLNRRVW